MGQLDNAVLLAIYEPGTPDDHGDITDPGTEAWSGTTQGYLQRVRYEQDDAGASTRTEEITLTLRNPSGLPFAAIEPGEAARGYTVLVEDGRVTPATERRYLVKSVDYRAVGCIADSMRLNLSEENV